MTSTGADGRKTYTTVPVGCKIAYVIDTRYQDLRYLGGGAYGAVSSATDVLTGKKVAIKKVANVFRDLFDAKRILRELMLLRHLGRGHENLLWLSDIMVSPPNKAFTDVYIVSDLMETELAKIIESRQVLSDSHIKYFLYQTLRGMKYLHSAGILHRDLKPQNILINSNCELVVADLGLARPMAGFLAPRAAAPDAASAVFESGDQATRPRRDSLKLPDEGAAGVGTTVGLGASAGAGGGSDLTLYVVTRWYRAPELLVSAKTYGPAVDMWSIGCILAELLGRRPLFPGRNHIDQLRLVLETLGSPPEEQLAWMRGLDALRTLRALPPRRRVPWTRLFPAANPQALDLLDALLQFDPTRRITVEAALAHPYLADYADPADEPAAEPLPALDWAFDGKEHVTRGELAGLMLAEMAHFRPGFGVAGGEAGARPKSVRMAALSSAAAAAAAVTAAAAAAVSQQVAGSAAATAEIVAGARAAARPFAPAPALAAQAGPAGTAAAASAAAQQYASSGSSTAAAYSFTHPAPQPQAPLPPPPATVSASAPTAAPPAPVPTKRSASDPGLPPPHHPYGAADTSSASTAGTVSAAAAAALGSSAASSSSSAQLLQALLGEMRGLRTDILASVDRRLGEAEAAVARKVDERVAAALGPFAVRLERLERALGLGGQGAPLSPYAQQGAAGSGGSPIGSSDARRAPGPGGSY